MVGSDFLPNEGSQAVDRIGIKGQSDMDDPEQPESEPEAAANEGEEFRDDEGEGDPIRVDDLKRLDLENMPEDAARSYRY